MCGHPERRSLCNRRAQMAPRAGAELTRAQLPSAPGNAHVRCAHVRQGPGEETVATAFGPRATVTGRKASGCGLLSRRHSERSSSWRSDGLLHFPDPRLKGPGADSDATAPSREWRQWAVSSCEHGPGGSIGKRSRNRGRCPLRV